MSTCRIGSGRSAPILLVMVLLAFSLGIALPTTALASEGEEEGRTGFMGGLQTLVEPDTSMVGESDPVRDYDYEPVLLEEPLRANGGELTELSTMDGIRQVVNRTNRVDSDWNSGGTTSSLTLIEQLRRFLGAFASVGLRDVWVTPAIVMVFGWWALRKTVRMIMRASKGKGISV